MSTLIYEFTSHVAGKNAKVSIFSDRLEWTKTGSAAGHAAKATVTFGLSLLGGKKEQNEMIPMRAISSVSTKKDGMMNSKVMVVAGPSSIDFRVSHSEAAKVKNAITQAMAA